MAAKIKIKYIQNNLKQFKHFSLLTPFLISENFFSSQLLVCQFGSSGVVLEPRFRFPSGQELMRSIWKVTCQRHSKGAIRRHLPKVSFELKSFQNVEVLPCRENCFALHTHTKKHTNKHTQTTSLPFIQRQWTEVNEACLCRHPSQVWCCARHWLCRTLTFIWRFRN